MTGHWGMIGANLESCRAAWAIRESGRGRIASVCADPAGWGRELLALTAARPVAHPSAILADPSISAVIIDGTTADAAALATQCADAGKSVVFTLPVRFGEAEAAQLDARAAAQGSSITALIPSAFVPEWGQLKGWLASKDPATVGTVRFGRLEQTVESASPDDGLSGAEAVLSDLIGAAETCVGALQRLRVVPAPTAAGREYLLAAGKFESGALVHLEAGLTESPGSQYFYFEVACANRLTEFDSRIEREYVLSSDTDASPLCSAYARIEDAYARALQAAASGNSPAGLLQTAARASAMAASRS